MRKAFSLLALAALTIGLLGSCSKINERLDGLEKKVSGIENEQIASINSQISGITSSISDLGQIRSDISSLKQSASDHSVDIFNLEEADRALKDRILNLEDYVDAVLPNYAEKEWVEATFSTLEQYEATCDTIAKIDAKIGTTSEKLSKDIKACADSLTKWVNKQFEGYYTAAQMDAKLAQMKAAVDSAKASGGITDAKADSIAAELAKVKPEVDTVKANIRAEYKAAVKAAIEESEGKLTKKLTNAISEVNGKIESLTTRVGNLETSVNNLLGRVKALEEMIQSVDIVPEYNDGSVKVEDDTLYIDCIVSPVSAVSGLTKANFKVLVNKVLTKAVDVKTISITEDKWFSKDAKNGTVSLKVPVKNYIPESADSSLTVAVNVQNGISDFTTEFVPVYVYVAPAPVAPEGFVDLGVKDANGKPLFWAEKNLGASNPEDYGKYFSWGDVTGQTPSGSTFSKSFSWSNAPFNGGKDSYDETEFNKVKDAACPNGILASAYDAATAANSSWRTPTSDEFKALAASCVWIWCDGENEKYNNTTVKGYIVYKAKNENDKGKAKIGNTWEKWDASQSKYVTEGASEATGYTTSDTHIFFPAAGCGFNTSLDGAGGGFYWSSSLNSDDTDRAYSLGFSSVYVNPQGFSFRHGGWSVRPVTSGVTPAPTPTTTGTAKATIGGSEVDVKWIQFSEDGPKFAEYNVGVTDGKAESYGGYYCWGKAIDKDASGAYKSGTDPLTGDDDTATKLWGSNWRMPTQAELQALLSNCDVEWIDGTNKKYKDTNITGLLCKGKGAYASNSVFLPAAGFCNKGSVSGQGSIGYYWSSTPDDDDFPTYARDLNFDSGEQKLHGDLRDRSLSVRAVLK